MLFGVPETLQTSNANPSIAQQHMAQTLKAGVFGSGADIIPSAPNVGAQPKVCGD